MQADYKTVIYAKDQKDLYYRVIGTGEKVLVLLHGIPLTGSIFDQQIEYLKNDCRLIVPDLPGSGLSPYNEALQSVDDFADCVHVILQNEQVEQCILLGHSMGGYITLAFLEKYPEMLEGFGFIHSTAYADSEEKKQVRQRNINFIAEHGVADFLKLFVPSSFSERYKDEHPDKVSELTEATKTFTPEALQQYQRILKNRPDRSYLLKDNEKPAFFFIGKQDTAVPLNDILQQVSLPKIASVHIAEKAAHMGMWEASDELNVAIKEYVELLANTL